MHGHTGKDKILTIFKKVLHDIYSWEDDRQLFKVSNKTNGGTNEKRWIEGFESYEKRDELA